MQRTFRSLIQTLLTVACALSLSLTGFDLPAQAESKNASNSATPASLAATPQTKRRRARRRSRAARSTVARRRRGVVYSNSAAPVVGAVKVKRDYIPPGGAIYGDPNATISSDEQSPPRPEPTPRTPRPGEIRGGILNGKAISLPKPVYPALARSARASGVVVVEVTVDEEGKVISGRALSGHPLLQAAAVEAAYQARFAPTKLSGRPVKVLGTISYHFVQ
jgi:TonB family protein